MPQQASIAGFKQMSGKLRDLSVLFAIKVMMRANNRQNRHWQSESISAR
jgi:hypothetical protein